MLRLFTITIATLIAIVALTAAAIVVVRVGRQVRQRRQAALAAGPRRALLAFVAENGERGGDELIAIPDDAWRAAESVALGLLGKLRGEAHLALVSVFLRRGTARAALRDLRSRSRVRRARAAQVLGDLELRQAVPQLCRLLTDRHAEVRVVAVRALGRIGDPVAAWRLIAGLDQSDPVPSLLATHTLVQLGPDAEVTISAALDHPEARVRAVCLDALGLLGAAGSVQRIARVLSAARALGDLGASSAVPALVALLGDGEFRVAHEAAHALRRLGRTGLDALHEVVVQERADALANGRGAHAKPSASASHAQEALALAAVTAEPSLVAAS